jgi:hypothetical protein
VSLAPGQVGVLVHNTAAFQLHYGTGPLILGDYLLTGQAFSNGGEHVALVDASGNLFIADSYNNRIREVLRSNGTMITIAGNGSTVAPTTVPQN